MAGELKMKTQDEINKISVTLDNHYSMIDRSLILIADLQEEVADLKNMVNSLLDQSSIINK